MALLSNFSYPFLYALKEVVKMDKDDSRDSATGSGSESAKRLQNEPLQDELPPKMRKLQEEEEVQPG